MAMKEVTMKEAQAINLARLVKEHKQNCEGENCTITLNILLPVYECLIGREANEIEKELFM